MSKVTLDAVLRERLNGLNEPLELCDEAGRTVGHFVPEEVYRKLLYRLAEAQCPYTAEELDRMRRAGGGRPLADLWKSLGGQ